jgi:sugar lactone lactonase YvrE
MKRGWTIVAALLLALAAYLLLWPVPIAPVAWQAAKSAGYQGTHARNTRLAAATQISTAPEIGPEHIVFGPDGKLYTGMLSGAILRMNADGSERETYVDTGGRPLGLDFDAGGRLIVADAFRGLLAVGADRSITVLVDKIGAAPILFADAVVVASDGRLLFTDASQRLSAKRHGTFDAALLDILEHSCTGRVLEFDPATASTRAVIGGLCFPNGIALSADQSHFFIAETGEYRIWKVARTARDLDARAAATSGSDPQARVIAANLPGFPDNLTRGADGRLWTGFTKPRSDAIDAMAAKPLLRAITLRLPRFLWPVPPEYGHIMAFDEDGRVVADLQDPSGTLPETSGATEHAGRIYVQSLHAPALGVIDLAHAGL